MTLGLEFSANSLRALGEGVNPIFLTIVNLLLTWDEMGMVRHHEVCLSRRTNEADNVQAANDRESTLSIARAVNW